MIRNQFFRNGEDTVVPRKAKDEGIHHLWTHLTRNASESTSTRIKRIIIIVMKT
jgi:hypothetical protein